MLHLPDWNIHDRVFQGNLPGLQPAEGLGQSADLYISAVQCLQASLVAELSHPRDRGQESR